MFVYKHSKLHPTSPGHSLCWYSIAGANLPDATAQRLAGPFGTHAEATAWIVANDPAHPLGVPWVC